MLQHPFDHDAAAPSLGKIARTVQELRALHAKIIKGLPPPLQSYCHSVYWSEDNLVLNITHHAALSKIRLLCPNLLNVLQQQGIPVRKIKPTIFFLPSHAPTGDKMQKMTPAALKAFEELAQTVTDPALKKAIATLLNAHK